MSSNGDQESTLYYTQIAMVEFIGTFFLSQLVASKYVFAIDGSQPIALGLGYVGILYATFPISGGQLNPAVTCGLLYRRKLSLREGLCCIVAQLLGGIFAGLVSYAIFNSNWDNVGYPEISEGFHASNAFVAEILESFLLVTVYMNATTTKAQEGKSFYGVAVGFVVLSTALLEATQRSTCNNSAVAMLALLQGSYKDLWVYFCAPLIGSLFACLAFPILNPAEDQHDISTAAKRLASLLTEFIGTFYLSYTVGMSVNAASFSNGFCAIGMMVASLIYMGAAISGAQYNPAVSLAIFIRRRWSSSSRAPTMKVVDLVMYSIVQVLASFAGALVAGYVNQDVGGITTFKVNTDHYTLFAGVVVEALYSFLLCFTVLMSGTLRYVQGNSYYGMACGFVVTAGIAAVSNISGGVFNPALGVSLPIIAMKHVKDIWVYVVGPYFGAVVAALVVNFVSFVEDGAEKTDLSHLTAF